MLFRSAYHAALLCGYDWFSRWNKTARLWGSSPSWRVANVVVTFHAFAFGIMLFNGHLTPRTPPRREEIVETCDCHTITGVAWDRARPGESLEVDIYVDYTWVTRVKADQFREDLQERGMGDGRHAFSYSLPSYVRNGHAHTIEARLAGADRHLRSSPAMITCAHEEPPK